MCLNRERNNFRKEKIMAVVRSLEGTFYDIPDSELEQYKVPADQVKGLMEAAGQKLPPSPGHSNRRARARARAEAQVDRSLRSLSSS